MGRASVDVRLAAPAAGLLLHDSPPLAGFGSRAGATVKRGPPHGYRARLGGVALSRRPRCADDGLVRARLRRPHVDAVKNARGAVTTMKSPLARITGPFP